MVIDINAKAFIISIDVRIRCPLIERKINQIKSGSKSNVPDANKIEFSRNHIKRKPKLLVISKVRIILNFGVDSINREHRHF